MLSTARVLTFLPESDRPEPAKVGRVHPDGSITFRGETYATIKDLPSECQALRPDLDTHKQWRRVYRVIDPRQRRPRKPRWLES